MKIKKSLSSFLILFYFSIATATEYHVSKSGADTNDGSKSAPFKTISRAAQISQPGDVITVHEGIYRERIDPPRGGTSDENRIIYQAAPGAKVVIKGSEVVTDWEKQETKNVWKKTIPNTFFGDFNPFATELEGHWFQNNGRPHSLGAVYLNGHWLVEGANMDDVTSPADNYRYWYKKVFDNHIEIYADFGNANPNQELVEINVRQSVFYPSNPGINFITVDGFTLTQAATPWAPPTVEQIGLIGTHWSKGWIIKNNTVSYSRCAGITLGLKDMGEYLGNLRGYTKMINFAMNQGGWDKDLVGSHLVSNNIVEHCEQGGIVGSLGGAFSIIEKNIIRDIHVFRLFKGQEQGGIKLHGAVDTVIQDNIIYDSPRAYWFDWMGQGGKILNNIGFNNAVDLYMEVNHGPAIVANNIFLSPNSISNKSRGTAFIHNLIAGRVGVSDTPRTTPFLKPHSTKVAGYHTNEPGDDRYYNNLFIGSGGANTSKYIHFIKKGYNAEQKYKVVFEGNVYLRGATPHSLDLTHIAENKHELPLIKPIIEGDNVYLDLSGVVKNMNLNNKFKLIHTENLGVAAVSGAPFVDAKGNAFTFDVDYLGNTRLESNVMPGPIQLMQHDNQKVKVWPKIKKSH